MILVDAGPLVALIHRNDDRHEISRETLRSLDEPLGTVWPVFTEAMYLLGFSWQAQAALWGFVTRGALALLPLGEEDAPRMRELMKKYRDLPMDLADAGLVRAAERTGTETIFTFDRRDFSVYRPEGIGPFTIVPE